MVMTQVDITFEMIAAEERVWKCLAGYKFWMFGYYAAKWVTLNNLRAQKLPNPFKGLVDLARKEIA